RHVPSAIHSTGGFISSLPISGTTTTTTKLIHYSTHWYYCCHSHCHHLHPHSTATDTPDTDEPPAKKARLCRACRQPGHNACLDMP
ncbi:MAG: hypothetical protein MJE68_23160, partial [Proteobacteria bacterium]|nr:hypothetical protein [Pseudomonadota bacterium]